MNLCSTAIFCFFKLQGLWQFTTGHGHTEWVRGRCVFTQEEDNEKEKKKNCKVLQKNMSLTEIYWAEVSLIVMKNISESEDKHKGRDQNEKNVSFGWNLWNSYQFTSSVRTEGFAERFFTLSYVEESPFYWVNRDKGCMLFHLLKFMMWVSHSSQDPKRRHFCIVLPLSHQAWAFAPRGSGALFCHYHNSARKKTKQKEQMVSSFYARFKSRAKSLPAQWTCWTLNWHNTIY